MTLACGGGNGGSSVWQSPFSAEISAARSGRREFKALARVRVRLITFHQLEARMMGYSRSPRDAFVRFPRCSSRKCPGYHKVHH